MLARPNANSNSLKAGINIAAVAKPYEMVMVLNTVSSWSRRIKLVIAKKVKKGSRNAVTVIAGDGFRFPKAT